MLVKARLAIEIEMNGLAQMAIGAIAMPGTGTMDGGHQRTLHSHCQVHRAGIETDHCLSLAKKCNQID